MQTHMYDGWVLRFSEGYTKRANSINPLYPSFIDPAEKIATCESIYQDRGLPVIFKLTGDARQRELENLLIEKGYEKIDATAVMTLPLRSFDGAVSASLDLEATFTEAWKDGFIRCNAINATYQSVLKKMLGNILGRKIIASKTVDGAMVACGFGVMERGYVGLFDIVVDIAYRGKGIGKDIVQGILAEAKRDGADTAYLQVLKGNAVAENLYAALGFRERYRYWYRKK